MDKSHFQAHLLCEEIEMASAISIFPLTFKSSPPLPSNPSLSLFFNNSFSSSSSSSTNTCWVLAHISNTYNVHSSSTISFKHSHTLSSLGKKSLSHYPSAPYSSFSSTRLICRAAEYKFPDPVPEFADAETEKFRNHLIKKLSKKDDLFGDSLDEVVGICTEGNPLTLTQVQGSAPRRSPGCPVVRSEPETITWKLVPTSQGKLR